MTIVLNSSSGNLLFHYVIISAPHPLVFLLFFCLKYIPLSSYFVWLFFCLNEIRWNNYLPGLGDVSFCGSILVCRLHMPVALVGGLDLKPVWVGYTGYTGPSPWIYWAITLARMSWSCGRAGHLPGCTGGCCLRGGRPGTWGVSAGAHCELWLLFGFAGRCLGGGRVGC